VAAVTAVDETGTVRAITACLAYTEIDGVTLPSRVEARFPQQDGAEMDYRLRESTTKVNLTALKAVEDLDEARARLAAEGYREIRGIPQ
jgi:hypothetical protein